METVNDIKLIAFVLLLFDEYKYEMLYADETYKNIPQVKFWKTPPNSKYYKGIVFCGDNEPPEDGVYYNVSRLRNCWFLYEEDPLGGKELPG